MDSVPLAYDNRLMRISGWRIHTASKRTLAAARNGPICDGQQQHSRRQTQTDAYPAFTNVAVRALGIRKRRAIQVILSIARVFLSLDDRSANAGSEGERMRHHTAADCGRRRSSVERNAPGFDRSGGRWNHNRWSPAALETDTSDTGVPKRNWSTSDTSQM